MQQQTQQKYYIQSATILRFLTMQDEALDTLIMCNSSYLHLYTFDQSLYEALGSLPDRNNINLNKLTKFLEVVDIVSMRKELKKPRPILREERVAEIQEKAKQKFGKEQVSNQDIEISNQSEEEKESEHQTKSENNEHNANQANNQNKDTPK